MRNWMYGDKFNFLLGIRRITHNKDNFNYMFPL